MRGRRYLVAITDTALDAEERRQIEAAGAVILGYVLSNGHRVSIDPAGISRLRALPFIVWLGEPPSARPPTRPAPARHLESVRTPDSPGFPRA